MKLISVQSRGDRLAIVERFEVFGDDYVLTKRKIQAGDKSYRKYGRILAFGTKSTVLKAAAKWLEGAAI